MNKTNEHRDWVKVNIEYIVKELDKQTDKLDQINGRVRQNEKSISYIKGIGTILFALFGGLIGWFQINK
tara:strand:+ start:127 stop:333 length:207 start_codon:yes stop_codon:yes gene_type:complete